MSTKPVNTGNLSATIGELDDRRAAEIVRAVTQARLDAGGPAVEWTPELGRALCTQLNIAAAASPAAPGELARHTLALLAQDREYAEPIGALARGPGAERYEFVTVGGALLVTAALLALQSHIEFERDKRGKWAFRLKKTPTKDAVITPLIRKLVGLISGGPPGAS